MHPEPPAVLAHREKLKVPRMPGSSLGMRCGQRVLFTLQMRSWSQGMVPEEGSGLLRKWLAGMPGDAGPDRVFTVSPPSAHSQPFIGCWGLCCLAFAHWGPGDRAKASPATESTWTLQGLTFILPQLGWGRGGGVCEWLTATRMEKEWPRQLHWELNLGETEQAG